MNVAFIPLRGGSKSIPLKNIKPLRGYPLAYWVIRAACACDYIDEVYVATDSSIIRNELLLCCHPESDPTFKKLNIIGRGDVTATDTASTEMAMLEFAAAYTFDNIVLIQATSPLLCTADLDAGWTLYSQAGTDSVLSVVEQKRFIWNLNQEGYAVPQNYDIYNRPRRQEFDGYLVENGAFYITSKEALLKTRNRISGTIRASIMNDASFLEIDEPMDWMIIENIMKKQLEDSTPNIGSTIKMLLTDCDGCLTDGGMYYSEKGDELKKFNTKDGMGFQMLQDHGILTGIVTGEDVDLNRRRAEKLNVEVYRFGVKNKAACIQDLCTQYHLLPQQIAYIGDDKNDISALDIVGFSCCPADAIDEVKRVVHYQAKANGGAGVIREIAEIIISKNDLS
jgi:N-acylneuraminate cytidylyltransferase